MANPTGKKPININNNLIQKLTSYQKTHKYNSPSFTAFVNELLEDVVEKDELLKLYAPSLSIIGYDENILYLKDSKHPLRFSEITMRNGKLYCNLDPQEDDDYCIHIRFALAIPEVARLNLK